MVAKCGMFSCSIPTISVQKEGCLPNKSALKCPLLAFQDGSRHWDEERTVLLPEMQMFTCDVRFQSS